MSDLEIKTKHDVGGCDVLVVDDDHDMVSLLLDYFATMHVNARGITTSLDYLEAIRDAGPRIVLLDVALPGANGYELCAAIKGDDRLHHIKVVLFSAMPMADVIKGVDESGADAYLLKPFNLADLDRMVGIGASNQHPKLP